MTIKFDTIQQGSCVAPISSTPDAVTCEVAPPIGPSTNDSCADPAYRAAHPDECDGYPVLIIKPELAILQSGKTVQFKTFLRANGNEQELTKGLTYECPDTNIAVIDASGGLATGVGPGITTVSVAWQNLHAYAQIQVVASCGQLVNNFFLLLDVSKSMGQGFNGSYPTKLAYAKATAAKFAQHSNLDKDTISVGIFDESETTLLSASQDLTAITATVNGITQTNGKTGIKSAVDTAIAYLKTMTGVRVLIVFSDGEDTGPSPLDSAQAFKDAGGVVVVVGTRCWGDYFDELYRLASAGYFLSAYGSTAASIQDTLNALKTYLCSGDCSPTPGTAPRARLNYNGFVNWDVTNFADLIGLGLWDVLPGNGLYVDLAGTVGITPGVGIAPISVPGQEPTVIPPGKLTSKTAYNFISGHSYKFRIGVGVYSAVWPVKVTIGALFTTTITPGVSTPLDDTVSIPDYEFTFVAGATVAAKIVVEKVADPYSSSNVGPIIDDVYLEHTTASTVLLDDDFNDENPTTIPPSYGYGYGCLTSPPGAQSADPEPPTPSVVE